MNYAGIKQISHNKKNIKKIQIINGYFNVDQMTDEMNCLFNKTLLKQNCHSKLLQSTQHPRQGNKIIKSPEQTQRTNNFQSQYKPQNQDNEISSYSFKQIQKVSQQKQTKNIPKLYGKNFIMFMKKIKTNIIDLINQSGISEQQFNQKVELWKKNIVTIKGIRQMWIQAYNSQAKVFRVLCNLFLRKHMLHNIFNSKIYLCKRALKYRYKFLEGVRNPQEFSSIKQY